MPLCISAFWEYLIEIYGTQTAMVQRCAVSPGQFPFAQVENLPEEFNDLTNNYIIGL